ncbi:translation initiation factor IF-2 [Ruminococcus flavefaciens]|uniref:Translation initiation factor IF-2 n=1 Tax=Ruminococcus flavefaciens TaxID=1265 RepID=A0A315XX27_RUMFL|nr:translation initiation factor IF-2 [Ruminococcus flavefaciens]PWJ10112.1 translation initiation factor IF-2 [Ruminococcus flavefaciens]SSA52066.1 translation initiation factor IF-2 [Ruminococcus flavefaciens]
MAKKIKLSDAAKDFNVPSQELIDFFAEKGDNKKKTGSSLSEEEMNSLLEHYTKDRYSVKSLDEYFNSKNDPRPVKEEAPKEEKKPAVKKSAEKKEDKKEEKKAAPAKKAEPEKKQEAAPAKKAEPEKKQEAAPAKKAEPEKKQEAAPAKKAEPEKKQEAAPAKKAEPEKKQEAAPVKKAEPEKKQEAAPVKAEEKPAGEKAQEPKKQDKKKDKKKEQAKAQDRGERTKFNATISSETAQTSTQRRTVDTRGSYVDLDKYNERYDQMATSNKHKNDNYSSKKQKINQKSAQRNRQQFSKKESEAEKLKRLELERARKQQLKVLIPDTITVGELATRLKAAATEVIKQLMKLGVMASINQEIDFDTASLVAEEMGAKVEKEVIVTIEERLIDDTDDDDTNLQPRCPVVVVMGHVDHGKTSILDRIRNAHVAAGEAGGITQHIGAYQVNINGQDITFLDTPGHEAFTAMRARGANITDIAILVVAADDGIMPQTVESINHAKAAGVSIIVAINKMDKEGANPDRIKEELTKYDLVCEDWGGDVICVPVSAKTGEGIDDLLENVLLVAEVKELKANPDRLAKGTVIEARLDKGRGPIATLLVQNGTLKQGDVLIAGTAVGRVRVMTNDKGRTVKSAGPSVPVEITGLAEVPSAGDTFNAVEDERLARELVEQRKHEQKQEQFNAYRKVTLDNLFSQIAEGEIKELPIVVKADVQGSVEAVKQSLEKLSNNEVRVRVIHGAVGAVKESDVMLASASNAIIVGFNVRPDPVAAENAERDGVDIRLYRIIYDAIEEIGTAMKGMLAPKLREVEQGRVEVRQVYKISNVGMVAGSYVLSGKVTRGSKVRVVRDGIIIADDEIAGLKRFKDDVKEVADGYECGISLEKFSDVKEGDIFETYIVEEYRED